MMTQIENTDSDNNSDYDSDYEEEYVFIEEDDKCNTKYNIVLCEIFNNLIHGKSNFQVDGHYLNICTFKRLNMNVVVDVCNLYNQIYFFKLNWGLV